MYDRFVAVFRICEAVFRKEYLNVKALETINPKNRTNFILEVLNRIAEMLFTCNKEGDTPKFVSDFNKPSSKYLGRLENYVLRTLIDHRRQLVLKDIESKIITNGEIPESEPEYLDSMKTLISYNFHKKLGSSDYKTNKIMSLRNLIDLTFDKNNDYEKYIQEDRLNIVNNSFSTSVSRRTFINDVSTLTVEPRVFNPKLQLLKAIND
jgi:hypothetical protein